MGLPGFQMLRLQKPDGASYSVGTKGGSHYFLWKFISENSLVGRSAVIGGG